MATAATFPITAREAHSLECRADAALASLADKLAALNGEAAAWRELRRSAIAMQDYLADPECWDWDVVAADMNDAMYELGLPRPAGSYIPMVVA